MPQCSCADGTGVCGTNGCALPEGSRSCPSDCRGQGTTRIGDRFSQDARYYCTCTGCNPFVPGPGVCTRTCVDTNGDGTSDDAHDCSSHANNLAADAAHVSCAADPCTSSECCTMVPPADPPSNSWTIVVGLLCLAAVAVAIKKQEDQVKEFLASHRHRLPGLPGLLLMVVGGSLGWFVGYIVVAVVAASFNLETNDRFSFDAHSYKGNVLFNWVVVVVLILLGVCGGWKLSKGRARRGGTGAEGDSIYDEQKADTVENPTSTPVAQ